MGEGDINSKPVDDELSNEEFELFNRRHDKLLSELHEVVAQSEEAREFLNTKFGRALRKQLVSEKMFALKDCVEKIGTAEQDTSVMHYKVIVKVEQIFGLIISDGEAALRQLTLIEEAGDINENYDE